MIEDSVINEVARRILAATPKGSRVILFGSYARGDAREGSDLDFLVVEPQLQDRHKEVYRLIREIRPLRLPVDLMVASEDAFKEWSSSPCNVLHEAARYGKVFQHDLT